MRVLLLSRYDRLGPSSRLRSHDFIAGLRDEAGIDVTPAPFFDDSYLEKRFAGKAPALGELVHWYARRLQWLIGARGYDLLWIEVELLPFLPYWLERLLLARRPYVLDCDDAWFHRYDLHDKSAVRRILARKIDRLMAGARQVIAGNDYIAARAEAAGAKRIAVWPTVVNLSRYSADPPPENTPPVIGWIGTQSSADYLSLVAPALRAVCRDGKATFTVIGANPVEIEGVETQFEPWREADEAEALWRFDIGIMPLTDGPWEKGKAGYKIIQYMAAGRPAVASNVGYNASVLRHGETGYLVETDAEWIDALTRLLDDAGLRRRLGERARRIAEAEYSQANRLPELAAVLRAAAD